MCIRDRVVHERPDATIAGTALLGGRLAINYLKDASSLLEVRELGGALVREVKLPGLGTVGGPSGLADDDARQDRSEGSAGSSAIHSEPHPGTDVAAQ